MLIADGNDPVLFGSSPTAKKVFLNLKPGLIAAMDLLDVVLSATSVQEATTMTPPADYHPSIYDEYKKLLGEKTRSGQQWNAGISTRK